MVATVNYYRPTYAAAEDIFTAPPEHRPFVDLSVTQDVTRLPIHLRKQNTGVTRWANLVIGTAVDGALERGVSPERIAEAFRLGKVVAHAEVVFDPVALQQELDLSAEDSRVVYEGRVTLEVDNLGGELVKVSGGQAGELPDASITFAKRNGVYVPHQAFYAVRDEQFSRSVDYADVTYQYGPAAARNPSYVPEEFIAPRNLGEFEENVTMSLEITVRNGDITNLQS